MQGYWEDSPLTRAVAELYAPSAQPAAVVDEDLKIIWANACATGMFSSFKMPDGLLCMLPGEEAARAAERLRSGAACMVRAALPLSNFSFFLSPLPGEEQLRALILFAPWDKEEDRMDASLAVSAFSAQLRLPLSATFGALGSAARIRKMSKDIRFDRPFTAINQNSYRILRHCVNLTEFARFTNAENPPNLETIDLARAVRALCEATGELTNVLPIPLEVSVPAHPVFYDCDSEKLFNALLNVLSNACKFTREGNAVSVTMEDGAFGVRIRVADHGCGIAPESLPHIFEPFYTCWEGHPDASGGGLGLPVAKLSLSCQSGSIAVHSTPGKGTVVVLTLPDSLRTRSAGEFRAPNPPDLAGNRYSSLYVLLSDVCERPWP